MNDLGKNRIPFVFIIDFEKQKPRLWPLTELPDIVQFTTPTRASSFQIQPDLPDFILNKVPPEPERYKAAFDQVQTHLHRGDTYLLNLTFPSTIRFNYTPQQIYKASQALYKLWIDKELVCFSPEIFVKIEANQIASFPMKGTLDARIPDAENILLGDDKETAEHNTIIDLIRNDLSIVARQVRLTRYRYLDRIKTHEGELLQVSSEIRGQLAGDWAAHIGEILDSLMPAGSVSGAPKEKTLEIIREVEGSPRGYYTGVFGFFDGYSLDSAVMIRYIDLRSEPFHFRSGGGITALSQWEAEYQELIQKVYVPLV